MFIVTGIHSINSLRQERNVLGEAEGSARNMSPLWGWTYTGTSLL